MEIQINNCPVDIELEGEKTVSDVIDSIAGWTKERDLIIMGTQIDDKSYLLDKIPDIPLHDVEIINCSVQSRSGIIISSLNSGIDYCNKVHTYIENSVREKNLIMDQIEPLISGIDWILEVLGKAIQLLNLDIGEIKYKDKTVGYYIDCLKDFNNSIKKRDNKKDLIELFDKKKDLFASIIDIFKLLLTSENMKSLVIQSIDSPDVLIDSVLKIKEIIPDQINNLEETAIAFQTGKDDIGSEKLQKFIDFIYDYSRICFQVALVFEIDLAKVIVDDISLDEKNREIQDLLSEIIYVMESNDIISLSDLLEYEISPIIERLNSYIDALISFITKDDSHVIG